VQAQDDEHPLVQTSSKEFLDSAGALDALKRSGFGQGLETPSFGASSSEQFKALVSEIKAEKRIQTAVGNKGTTYDVILQPGHYGRMHGKIGTSGHYVLERALAAYITDIVATKLREGGLSVLVISADNYLRPTPGKAFDGLKTKVFLSIHADGVSPPCKTGPSLAYKAQTSPYAMHAVGWGLASALGYSYTDFRKDNYTVNEARYYMFSQVQAERLTGLLEMGELTCEDSEKKLIANSKLVGANIARALNFVVQAGQ
jgi:N-acetylmuramoyl-L-alanine amidase